jgi:hypothetical protein
MGELARVYGVCTAQKEPCSRALALLGLLAGVRGVTDSPFFANSFLLLDTAILAKVRLHPKCEPPANWTDTYHLSQLRL